jgi:hypothetical protein
MLIHQRIPNINSDIGSTENWTNWLETAFKPQPLKSKIRMAGRQNLNETSGGIYRRMGLVNKLTKPPALLKKEGPFMVQFKDKPIFFIKNLQQYNFFLGLLWRIPNRYFPLNQEKRYKKFVGQLLKEATRGQNKESKFLPLWER